MKEQRFKRSSGVVMPIFSLPSPYGIGTIGKCAYDFVDFLQQSGQTYWQILPIGHTGYGDSPYQCYSTVAGNPYFIDLDDLINMGLLEKSDIENNTDTNLKAVDYQYLRKNRLKILRKAFQKNNSSIEKEIGIFKLQNEDWVFDYALFMSLRDYFQQKAVWDWDDVRIKRREPSAVDYYYNVLKDDVEFYIFIQYLFFKQWKKLKNYANEKGIKIIGDIPMYPSPDSVDIWVNPKLFKVDEDLHPIWIAGVPPDYYSATGQVWGNPVYDWEAHKSSNYSWWIWRIKRNMNISDVIRIDHFRAFQDYFEIPSEEETAINGKWIPGPRMELFNAIKNQLGDIPIIAEDLGIIDDSVRDLLRKSGYPGMRVMIFGFRENEDNIHLPHNWENDLIGYTSTHDSETIYESVFSILNEEDRRFALEYLNNQNESVSFSAIRSAFSSPANVIMIMATDLLSLGKEGRINIPGTVGSNNWSWRVQEGSFNNILSKKLLGLTKTYKRLNW